MATIDQIIKLKTKKFEKDLMDVANDKLSKLLDNELRDAIEDTVYSRPESDYYERSRGLLNSTTSSVFKNGNVIEIKSYNEPTLMDWQPYEEHSSWVYGSDERDNIALWIALGHGGLVNYSATNYHLLALQRLKSEKQYINIIKRELKAKGYLVK